MIGDGGDKAKKISDINENIGVKSGEVSVPFVHDVESVLAYLQTAFEHNHGETFVYPKYAAPIQLTSGSGAWDTDGAIVEVVPVDTLTNNFDLHWISISEISATSNFIIDIYVGGVGEEVLITSVDGFRNSNFIQEGPRRIQNPLQLANSRISCKLSDSTSGQITCSVKLQGHYY